MLKVIINADDLGMSTEVNRAVVRALQQRLCSSATLMANMPGFTEACELIHENKLIDRVGLHLNLGEGIPLSDSMRRSRTFTDDDGRFKVTATQFPMLLSCQDRRILSEEIRAQIRRCRQMGLLLTHVDSHRHIHTRWAILSVLLAVASEEHIPYIRIPRNCGEGIGPVRTTYKWIMLRWITEANMRGTKYFGDLADYAWLKGSGHADGSMEIMVHPRYVHCDLLCNYPSVKPLTDEIQSVESYYKAISFHDIDRPFHHGLAR